MIVLSIVKPDWKMFQLIFLLMEYPLQVRTLKNKIASTKMSNNL
jgi:hypothetical protein